MTYEFIKWEMPEPHIGLLTLNRPERMNALGLKIFEEIKDVVDKIERDEDVYVYLVTGAPRADGTPCFSAGADMKGRLEDGPTPVWLASGVMNQIDEMLKPSVAVADGVCTTGGMELFMACDIRVASETARFFDWHLKRTGAGLGTWGASTRLQRIVGNAKAKEMLLTGVELDGKEAHRVGLVNRVFPREDLMEGAMEVGRSIAGMRPDGVKLTMGFLETSADMQKHDSLRWALQVRTLMGIDGEMDQASEAFVKAQAERKGSA